MSLRIHHLNCGTMCPHGRRLMAGEGGWLEPAEMCCHCLLIETADGLILVDSGLGADDVGEPQRLGRAFLASVRPQLRIEETALSQVRALGYSAADVRHLVVTHLDLDHAGGLPDFPDAQVHVFDPELRAAMAPDLRERLRYCAAQWTHGPDWRTYHLDRGERWYGFDAVRAIEGTDAEVLLLPLTGHTRGHCGVAVRTGEGWLLHCGDAYFFHGEVEPDGACPIGLRVFQNLVQINGRQRLHNQRRLRELKAAHGDEIALFCAHDPAELAGLAA